MSSIALSIRVASQERVSTCKGGPQHTAHAAPLREARAPDEDEDVAQVAGRGLKQLQHVWEDANGQRQVHRPGAFVQEAAQQD